MRRFGGDPSAIGRTLVVSGTPLTIVGVTPAEFFGTEVGTRPGIFLPMMMQPAVMPLTGNLLQQPRVMSTALRSSDASTTGVARTGDGATGCARARSETDWRPTNKFTGQREDLRLELTSAATGLSDLRHQFSQPLFILLSVAALVLLIACANVGTLMLARATARRPEFSLRLALGAGRGRLYRQLLVEAGMLAAFGGAAGVALAYWLTQALVATPPSARPRPCSISPDTRVLAFTASITIVAGILVGLVPAMRRRGRRSPPTGVATWRRRVRRAPGADGRRARRRPGGAVGDAALWRRPVRAQPAEPASATTATSIS